MAYLSAPAMPIVGGMVDTHSKKGYVYCVPHMDGSSHCAMPSPAQSAPGAGGHEACKTAVHMMGELMHTRDFQVAVHLALLLLLFLPLHNLSLTSCDPSLSAVPCPPSSSLCSQSTKV